MMVSFLGQFDAPDLTAQFQPVLDALPPLALVGLGVLVVAGLVLWIMGRTLAKAACVISGLLLGALAGLAIGRALADQGAYVLPLMLGGGIAGALLAALLFRLWMGLVAAIIFGLLAPAAVVAWQRVPPPEGEVVVIETEAEPGQNPLQIITDLRSQMQGDADAEDDEAPSLWQRLRGWYDSTLETAQAKWAELPGAVRHVLLAAGGLGMVAGLIFGLVAPNVAASLLSALLGAIMMYYPGSTILQSIAPEQARWLPTAPGPAMATVGLITLAGFAVQWMLFRRSADKR